ncbi:MAG: TetR/AcrR family transcriptional regulator [Alphaproteobacteria bacterium]|nr:TetR/AcrR family transcriptional regulator [Alphaproteobacteria bacterium]
MEHILAKRPNKEAGGARERLIDSAYDLFAARGVDQTGIDAILERSGCAKASLYDHFGSKLDLAIAFLDRREERWTRAWLEAEITKRASDPVGRLLAVFDIFDGWFRRRDFEGCSFINVLLESEPGSKLRRSASAHLAKIRAVMRGLAEEAGLAEPEIFAQAWHMMMKGSIIAAGEGNRNAARDAKRAATLVLAGWPRGPQRAAGRKMPAPSVKARAPRRQAPKRRKDAAQL